MTDYTGMYVIVRCKDAGVFAGILKEYNSGEAELADCRRIWYWDGAASLSQMALDGVSKPQNCKFPAPVASIIVMGVIEIIPCTVVAESSIRSVPVWKI